MSTEQLTALLILAFVFGMGSLLWRIMGALARFLNAQADLADARAKYIRARTPTAVKPAEPPVREPARAPRAPHVAG